MPEIALRKALNLPLVAVDGTGQKIVFGATINSPQEPGEVKQTFLCMLEKFLTQKFKNV